MRDLILRDTETGTVSPAKLSIDSDSPLPSVVACLGVDEPTRTGACVYLTRATATQLRDWLSELLGDAAQPVTDVASDLAASAARRTMRHGQ